MTASLHKAVHKGESAQQWCTHATQPSKHNVLRLTCCAAGLQEVAAPVPQKVQNWEDAVVSDGMGYRRMMLASGPSGSSSGNGGQQQPNANAQASGQISIGNGQGIQAGANVGAGTQG